jgi:hypothetical protein
MSYPFRLFSRVHLDESVPIVDIHESESWLEQRQLLIRWQGQRDKCYHTAVGGQILRRVIRYYITEAVC